MSPIREEPKKRVPAIVKLIAIPIFFVFIAFLLVSGMIYFLTIDDGAYREGDEKSTPYAVAQFTDNVVIFEDGTMESSMTAEELWNKMLEDGSRFYEYLDEPKELKKLINAQLITNNLDTRTNPNLPIDWNKINEDTDSKDVQGIIKLKRADTNGNTSLLKYTDPETFQSYIDEYNNTGSETAKKNALKHFTIEKGYTYSSGGGNYQRGTDGEAKIIEAGTVIEIPQGQGYGTKYKYNSWQLIGAGKQLELRQKAGMTFDEEDFGRINGRYAVAVKPKFGKVGDYIDYYYIDSNGDEKIIPCIICDVKGSDAKNEWGHDGGTNILEFYVNEVTWCTPNWPHGHSWYKSCGQASSMHVNPGTNGFHMEWVGAATKIVNGGSYFENPDFVNNKIEPNVNNNQNNTPTEPSNGNGSSNSNGETAQEGGTTESTENEPLKWPTDPGAGISSYFGPRTSPTPGASTYHQGIDIGVAYKEVYATESGTVVNSEYKDLNGNWIKIDHGNGYESVYLHNDQLLVNVGDVVAKGQVIAISGNTGIGTAAHLHFGIKYNGNYIDPLLFKYDNGKGNGTGGFGSAIDVDSTGGGVTSGAASYYAKVATWNEVTEIVETNDPEQTPKNVTKYNMTSTKVNYQQLVSKYNMPFDYLWALLVISEDKDFVMEIADLVYGSEIEITVYDNLMTNTSVMTDTYTKATKVITDDVEVYVEYKEKPTNDSTNNSANSSTTNSSSNSDVVYSAYEYGGPFTDETTQDYKTTTTIITKTNTLNVALTKADVWIVKYEQEFEHTPDTQTNTSNTPFEDEEYPSEDTPDKQDKVDALGLAESFRSQTQYNYEQNYKDVSTTVTDLTSKYYYKTINKNINTVDTTDTLKYISSPAVMEEKTDKESKEPNFVTIFLKYRRARHTILRSYKLAI